MSNFGLTYCKVNALSPAMSKTDEDLYQINTGNKKDRKADTKMPDILNSLADTKWDDLSLHMGLQNKLFLHQRMFHRLH